MHLATGLHDAHFEGVVGQRDGELHERALPPGGAVGERANFVLAAHYLHACTARYAPTRWVPPLSS